MILGLGLSIQDTTEENLLSQEKKLRSSSLDMTIEGLSEKKMLLFWNVKSVDAGK